MVEREQIQGLADELKDYLYSNVVEDAKLVQKGLVLYRQNMVTQLQIAEGTITATVQDVMPAKVKLETTFLAASDCTCPGEGLCRHQLAVFFSAYARIGSVTDWVSEWREPVREQRSAASWGLQRAKDLIKNNGVLAPNYERWVETFELGFETLLTSKKYTSPFVVPELFGIYQRRIRASAPVEQEWRLLYELVSTVVSFRKLAELSEQLGHDEEAVNRAYLHLFHNMMQDAEDLTRKISVQAMPFAFDEFIVKLKVDVLVLLTCTAALEYERIYLYRLLWRELFRKKDWLEEEISLVRNQFRVLEEGKNPVPLMVAEIHLYFLLQDDERALKLIDSMVDEFSVPYLSYWVEYLSGLKAWKRVQPLIDLFLQKARRYLEALDEYRSCAVFTRDLLRAMTPFCANNNRLDLYERALLATLPYSFTDYEYFLFERGQYDRWGELQAFVGFNYYDLPKERVKIIEKDRPEVLLGMLHQTAQREIDQKNRASYRMAVRHLKKLRTLYKKLKRNDDWDYFMTELLERTKRLRAFQEECQRSKLI
ncbi:SWIM zinc finger family protein [Bacillus sp. BRMEA1]|uniref:SWIM zinc finger family protein n=1 Tax=Neobacillus endophyticus TaxID=2738405 RepID=UPI0015675AF6|nr:SWIM zinc finger family protein [Neobacillus endophyticus]NRD77140.1 SWIM zinc finger family protein [Neobacillus endophyticus]